MAKPGRKKRPRTTAEKLVMTEVREQLLAKLKAASVEEAAEQLGVCRASIYNYIQEKNDRTPVPTYEILKRMHDRWGFKFKHIDFANVRPVSAAAEPASQGSFSFLDNVDKSDIEVTSAKPVGRDTLQLVVKIRFAS